MITWKVTDDPDAVDYSDMWLPMWIMYDHPLDFPDHVVVRLWESRIPAPTNVVMLFHSIEEAQAAMTERWHRLPRFHNDEPSIVEAWV